MQIELLRSRDYKKGEVGQKQNMLKIVVDFIDFGRFLYLLFFVCVFIFVLEINSWFKQGLFRVWDIKIVEFGYKNYYY